MGSMALFACPACALASPIFHLLTMVVGPTIVSAVVLRPFVRGVRKVWGWPRMDRGRLSSLLLLLLWLVPLWFLGENNHSAQRASICVAGLSVCFTYLWFRFCWLLDQHGVTATWREIVFPGILWPIMILLGTIVGAWILSLSLLLPDCPTDLLWVTGWAIFLGVPVGLFVIVGLGAVFDVNGTAPRGAPTT